MGLDISSRQLGITGDFPVQEGCTQIRVLERSLGWLWGGWVGRAKSRMGQPPWKLFLVSRGACLWRPWLSSARDLPQWWGKKGIEAATGGATGAKVIKAASEFHHPVRLFWPKSRSFDYLYSDGEILLQNFPIQATINLYEDSDDEEEEEEEEKEREEEKKLETDERGLGEHVRGPGSAPPRAIAHPLSPLMTGPN
ncbi:protein ripply1 isoform X1 [Canis lupus familiaris]|uniref:protein ripply1 isoform X1 n=1 Tax=Canis lupus familiaris TaxID=9615 RepID=UPI0018F64DD5|nr:protein ripply1 isoform X1 [Canis lupus familiaris]